MSGYKLLLIDYWDTTYFDCSSSSEIALDSFRLFAELHSYILIYFAFVGSLEASCNTNCIDWQAFVMYDAPINSTIRTWLIGFTLLSRYFDAHGLDGPMKKRRLCCQVSQIDLLNFGFQANFPWVMYPFTRLFLILLIDFNPEWFCHLNWSS